MGKKIDTAGTYVGPILESGFGATKNGYPQWIVRVGAAKKFVNDAAELAHFQLTEPQYVDWSSFDESALDYLVLYKSTTDLTPENALLNYQQAKAATGWSGLDFDSLANGDLIGKEILFRIEEQTYEGKTQL